MTGPPRRRRSRPRATHPKTGTNVEPTLTAETRVTELDDIRPGPLRAWAAACWHLSTRGLPPLPPEHVRRALARRGWWHR